MLTPHPFYYYFLLYFSSYLGACAYGFIYLLSLRLQHWPNNHEEVSFLLGFAGLAAIFMVWFSAPLVKKVGASWVCALGMLICGLSYLLLSFLEKPCILFYSVGLLLGAGWSLFYASTPMVLTSQVTDRNRGKHLSVMAACIVLGTGTGPALCTLILSHGISIQTLYLCPIFLSFSAMLLFSFQSCAWKNMLVPRNSPQDNKKSFFRQFLFSEAKYPCLMVFLGAGLLSVILNFQINFASLHQLNYSHFYFCYIVAVISSRFLFGGYLTQKNPLMSVPYLLVLMLIGLAIMLRNELNTFWYLLSALSLGISYGLVYPLIKTYAVNVTPPRARVEILSYFTLFYFIGIYGFPLIGSLLILHLGFKALLIALLFLIFVDLVIALSRVKNYQHSEVNYGYRT